MAFRTSSRSALNLLKIKYNDRFKNNFIKAVRIGFISFILSSLDKYNYLIFSLGHSHILF